MKYVIVIERAGDNYSAYSPDVPGCGATGDTIEEVTREIHGALQFHIEGLKQEGLPIPLPTSVIDFIEVAA
jgi:predicted RNase H-like HicB family nuclease